MDWILWVVRVVLIAMGIIAIIMVSKRKKAGIYQGQYYIGIFVIGCTAFTLGVILLIVSSVTDLPSFSAFYLMAMGAIALIISLVARKIWQKNS